MGKEISVDPYGTQNLITKIQSQEISDPQFFPGYFHTLIPTNKEFSQLLSDSYKYELKIPEITSQVINWKAKIKFNGCDEDK